MSLLPSLIKALDVELIRDGGSFAAWFEAEDGSRYILFTQVRFHDHGNLRHERIGYELPVLIDCDPAKRPRDTDEKTYGELSGPGSSVSWEQAQTLMALASSLTLEDEWRRDWLVCMDYVVSSAGGVPPAMRGTTRWRRITVASE